MLVKLKNDEIRNIMKIEDALDIVAEFAGNDVSEYLSTKIEDLNEEIKYGNQDLEDMESQCMEYSTTIFKIQDEVDLVLKQ